MSSSADDILTAPTGTQILLVRHAEVHNPTDIVYARLPRFRLSERGRSQAELIGRFLSARPLDALYTSPLLRARETAGIVARYQPGLRPRRSSAVIEVRTGYQGSPNTILKPGFSFYDPLKSPGDETMQDVYRRFYRFVRRLSQRHAGQTVAIVSHADPIAIARLGINGEPLTVYNLHHTVYPARASITQLLLSPSERPRLTYFDIVGDGPT